MKHFLFAAAMLLAPLFMFGQSEGYAMFENFYFTPKNGHAAELEQALGDHNRKWHGQGDYAAQVYYVMNGPRAGQYIWSMGPTTWTKIDSRPADDGHDGDWDKNVSVHIESYGATDFYRMDQELSRFTGPFDLGLLELWHVELEDGQGYRFRALLERVKDVNEQTDAKLPFGVYWRQLSGSQGTDVVLVWFHESLTEFDQPGTFRERYEGIHGEGSMDNLIDEWDDFTKSMEIELWQFVPEMSGHDGKGVARNN